MKPALALFILALVAATALLPSQAYAQIELTEADPPDGAQLDAPPEVVHLCFSEPVKINDPATFEFGYMMPDGLRLGQRIVFQSDGECVDVFPGLPQERPAGEYTFEWQVTAAQGDELGSGTLRFEVTKASGATPVPSITPSPGSPADSTPEAGGDEAAADGDGPDILLVALITIASVGGAAVLFTLGYFLRRRIGYEPHRPSGDDEGGGDH